MTRHSVEWRASLTLLTSVVVVGLLYWAQDVFVLLAMGFLLSFLLNPLVTRLEHLRAPRPMAALAACALAFAALVGLTWVITHQGVDLVEKLPSYQKNLEDKIDALRGKVSGVVSSAAKTIDVLGKKAAEATAPPAPTETRPNVTEAPAAPEVPATPPPQPTRVTVVNRDTPLSVLGSLFATLASPLGKTLVVFFLAYFMLVERAQIIDRVIRLAGRSRLNLTTQALHDVGARVSRYLAMQLVVNATYGTCVAIGLALIGTPNAILFGLLAAILRFLPYVGFWIAAALPLVLSFASPSWYEPLLTIGLFATLEIAANYIEPALYGFSTGLSPVAVVVAALFWTFIWGPAGLLLSTPLTVVLVVLGKYVPSLEFLAVALSDSPALEPHWRLYQRLLAAEYEDAEELFETVLHERSLEGAYDTVVLPALVLAERDYHHGRIEPVRRQLVLNSVRDFVEMQQPAAKQRAEELKEKPAVLCLPARDEADGISAKMLAQVLIEKGINAQAAGVEVLASELLETIAQMDVKVVCISAVPPAGMRHARYLYKRIRARFPDVYIVIGSWTRASFEGRSRRVAEAMDAERECVVSSLASAVEQIGRWVEISTLQKAAAR